MAKYQGDFLHVYVLCRIMLTFAWLVTDVINRPMELYQVCVTLLQAKAYHGYKPLQPPLSVCNELMIAA